MTVAELQEKYMAQIIEYKQLHAQGELSDSEYKELIEDIIDSDKIRSKLDAEEDVIQIGNIIEVLGTVAKVL